MRMSWACRKPLKTKYIKILNEGYPKMTRCYIYSISKGQLFALQIKKIILSMYYLAWDIYPLLPFSSMYSKIGNDRDSVIRPMKGL